MEQVSIPEKWIGEMVAVVDKQAQDATNGRLLEVNDRGIALRAVYEIEAEEGEPARLLFSTNFCPWSTVRFMWKPDENETQVLEDEVASNRPVRGEAMHEKPLNQTLLDLNEKVTNAIFYEDNTGEREAIEGMKGELEANPGGGPKVVREEDERGVWKLLTLEDGYSGGYVGTVYEDTGEGEPDFDDAPRRP